MFSIFQKSLNKEQRKGLKYGVSSPLFYSLDSLLDIILFGVIFSAVYRSQMHISVAFVYSVITSIIKDTSLFLYVSLRKNKHFFQIVKNIYKNKPKVFWLTVVGSISGGPLGFSLTTATILYNGAAYGSALSNFSPVVVLILCRIFLRTKINKIGWLGVLLTIIGFVGLAFSKAGSIFHFDLKIFVGVILAIVTVLTWSVETFVAEYVEKLETQAMTTYEKLTVKSLVSAPFMLTILLPASFLITFLFGLNETTTKMLSKIFKSWEGWLILGAIGLIVTLGRFGYWKAIEYVGGGRADILYYLTILMVPILTFCLYLLNVPGFKEKPEGIFQWHFWFFIMIQITGIILIVLTSINSKEKYIKNSSK